MNRTKFILTLGVFAVGAASQATICFDNVTANFVGGGIAQGSSGVIGANTITRFFSQKLIVNPSFANKPVNRIQFSVANFNAVSVSARMRVRFHQTNGAGGGPGTLLVGFSFNPLTFGPGVTTVTGTLGAGLVIPANNELWAGLALDNNAGTTGATQAQLDNMGQGLFGNPPSVGTTQDNVFFSNAPGDFLSNNPAGTMGPITFNGANRALGWRLEAVPEPASMAVLGIGALALLRRRKKA
ncbi:MAG: PEP-CTERM sorting domain-containing protein [Fimbriimonadaceae bacterium]|nr:PEP-CTERM sorting domain-containing protein [Fimbriimonadaceae bacterium]